MQGQGNNIRPWDLPERRAATEGELKELVQDAQNTLMHPDLDQANIASSPRGLLRFFHRGTAVRLVSHAPHIKDNGIFDGWVYIAQAIQYLAVEPQHKVQLIAALQRHGYVVTASPYPLSLIGGQQVILMADLIRCLEEIQCLMVRVQGYGMKYPLETLAPPVIVTEEEHPLARTNRWDISRSWITSKGIVLGRFKLPRPEGGCCWPILLEAGDHHGTLRWTRRVAIDGNEQIVQLKVYSGLIHVLKVSSYALSLNHMF